MVNISNKTSIIVGSTCKYALKNKKNTTLKDNKFFKTIKRVINKKFKNKKIKISVIITAQIGIRNKTRTETYNDLLKESKNWLFSKHLNYPLELIDCSTKNNIEKFKKSINSSQIIFVLGGDTLYLMYHLKKSKMDKLIKERIKNKKALYIGCSAGSIITGNTIAPTMFLRQNKTKKQKKYLVNTYKKKYWKNKKNIKALGLFNNKNVIPHCNSRYLRLKNKLEKNLNKKTKKNICLNENQIGILS